MPGTAVNVQLGTIQSCADAVAINDDEGGRGSWSICDGGDSATGSVSKRDCHSSLECR